jgi:glycosyltransferase involved in cell wall biosynthesis
VFDRSREMEGPDSQGAIRVLVTVPWGTLSGGAEAMLSELLEGGPSHGYELELVFMEAGPWPARLAAEGRRVEVIEAGRVRELHRWVASVRRLARIIRERDPDLIVDWAAKTHLHGAPAAILAGRRERVLWWQHAVPEGHWIDVLATLLPAKAIGCTAQYAAEAQRRLRPRRPLFVVPAGSPPPAPHEGASDADALALSPGTPVVGIVGRLQLWKGQDRLLRALALLRDRGVECQLVIVGGDSFKLEPEYAASLHALIEELGLSGAVIMTGEVPDAGPYIEHFDVLVNASDPEPFGIVLLEGMARGVAVVAVDNGGPREIVEPGRTGVLARSGEPRALADALEPLLRSPELRRELGRAGRERFERHFTTEAMCRRFGAQMRRLASR